MCAVYAYPKIFEDTTHLTLVKLKFLSTPVLSTDLYFQSVTENCEQSPFFLQQESVFYYILQIVKSDLFPISRLSISL